MWASGSGSITWNILHGQNGAITTQLFATDRSASGSVTVVYETFADATIDDGSFTIFELSSESATLENADIGVCYLTDA